MKQKTNHPSGGKLRALFCLGLTAALAAGIALNGTAATVKPVQYDIEVWSSSTHTVALSGGDLYAWGTNEQGQFPGSTLIYSPEPVEVQSKVADAAVSENRTLTVSASGELRTYGIEPSTGRRSSSKGTSLAKDAAQVEASDSFAAYISKTGALYTWGKNDFSQLGNGSTEDSATPVKILDSGVKKVSLGNYFGLALMEDGSVYGWGSNGYLQLGITEHGKPVTIVSEPVKIADGVRDISAGAFHSCLLKQNGSLWTCGDNNFSQTGTGDTEPTVLQQVMTGVRSVAAGSYHNFVVSNDGAVYAWGYGISGQLGSGVEERWDVPLETELQYVQIFACDDNTFGITPNGSVFSFGNNTNYRLGKSNGADSLLPVRILDQDMNWVYSEKDDDNLPNFSDTESSGTESSGTESSGTESSGTESGDPSGSGTVGGEPSDLPPENVEPEIVTTPFISGYGDGTFRPSKEVTRAEYLRMAVDALCDDFNAETNYGTCSFSDVPLGKWYEKYVAYAERKGFVSGYADGTFHPDEPISRAELSVLTARIMGLDTENVESVGFTDVPAEGWKSAAINALANEGILSGDGNGKFRPNDSLARKEAVVALSRAAGFRPSDAAATAFKNQFKTSPFSDASTSGYYYVYLLRAVGYVK